MSATWPSAAASILEALKGLLAGLKKNNAPVFAAVEIRAFPRAVVEFPAAFLSMKKVGMEKAQPNAGEALAYTASVLIVDSVADPEEAELRRCWYEAQVRGLVWDERDFVAGHYLTRIPAANYLAAHEEETSSVRQEILVRCWVEEGR